MKLDLDTIRKRARAYQYFEPVEIADDVLALLDHLNEIRIAQEGVPAHIVLLEAKNEVLREDLDAGECNRVYLSGRLEVAERVCQLVALSAAAPSWDALPPDHGAALDEALAAWSDHS